MIKIKFTGTFSISLVKHGSPEEIVVTKNTEGWLSNVASTGTFTKPEALTATSGANYIPNNWTVINK